MAKDRIILRGDGTTKTGFGHVYRLLALGAMLYDDFDCVFVSHQTYPFLQSELERLSIDLIQVPEIDYDLPDNRLPGDEVPFDMDGILTGSEIVVTDGYWFGPVYQAAIKRKGNRLVCIDDLAEHEFASDVVLNHSPGASDLQYRCATSTRLCLGMEYLLIRPEFLQLSIVARPDMPGKKVLLSVGGSDHYGITPRLLAAVMTYISESDKIYVLTTSSFAASTRQQVETIREQAANPNAVEIVTNLNEHALCDLMDSCTHAIVPGSTISLEVVSRGIKPLLGYYVSNQRNIFQGLAEKGFAMPYGDFQSSIQPAVIDTYLRTSGTIASLPIEQKTKNVFHELAATKS